MIRKLAILFMIIVSIFSINIVRAEKLEDNYSDINFNCKYNFKSEYRSITNQNAIEHFMVLTGVNFIVPELWDVLSNGYYGGKTVTSFGVALNYDNLCANDSIRNVVRIFGHVIQVAKWVIPFIIMVFGMVDFGKAVVSNDEKAVSKALITLIKRFTAGVIVFFVPTMILAILNAVEVTRGIEDIDNTKFGLCTRCLFNPNSDECKEFDSEIIEKE